MSTKQLDTDTIKLGFGYEQVMEIPNILTVTVTGTLDTQTKDIFTRSMDYVYRREPDHLIFLFNALKHISSIGFSSLLEVHSRISSLGGHVVIVGANESSIHIIKTLGMQTLLPYVKTLDEALTLVCRCNDDINIFPISIHCPLCNRCLRVPKEGTFRCGGCKAPLIVDKFGGIFLA